MERENGQTSILVVDEQAERGREWLEALARRDLTCTLVATMDDALKAADQAYFELTFLQDGREDGQTDNLLLRLLDRFPEMVVTVVAPWATLKRAVDVVRWGAFNYIPEPKDTSELLPVVNHALEYRRLRREKVERRQELFKKYDVQNIVGESTSMQKVFRLIHKVARTDATVLIRGESGTGKELVARAIHHHSHRQDQPLVPVNCGSIPEDLLESELFGHEKGAFTGAIKTRRGRFELAESGTIFLDEIGDMSPRLQVKLLRVLQEHQFERVGGDKIMDADIRVLAATHQDLEEKVKDGSFREDLFYRLNVVPIRVPPLRERRSDIPLLCDHFLERLGRLKGLDKKNIHPEVMERLFRYEWPGNVRELENVLERMVILADGSEILPEDLPGRLQDMHIPYREEDDLNFPESGLDVPAGGLDFNQAVDDFERTLILQALERTGWVKNRAAALLRLNRTTLVEKIKKKGLAPDTPEDS